MSLFQCENCGCCENTACSMQGFDDWGGWFDWTGIEELKGKKLCSACGPALLSDGDETPNKGLWHGEFDRVFLPMGKFKTNGRGNLEHVETGGTDYRSYAIERERNIISRLTPKFLSGNEAPVEGATVTAKEWMELLEYVASREEKCEYQTGRVNTLERSLAILEEERNSEYPLYSKEVSQRICEEAWGSIKNHLVQAVDQSIQKQLEWRKSEGKPLESEERNKVLMWLERLAGNGSFDAGRLHEAMYRGELEYPPIEGEDEIEPDGGGNDFPPCEFCGERPCGQRE